MVTTLHRHLFYSSVPDEIVHDPPRPFRPDHVFGHGTLADARQRCRRGIRFKKLHKMPGCLSIGLIPLCLAGSTVGPPVGQASFPIPVLGLLESQDFRLPPATREVAIHASLDDVHHVGAALAIPAADLHHQPGVPVDAVEIDPVVEEHPLGCTFGRPGESEITQLGFHAGRPLAVGVGGGVDSAEFARADLIQHLVGADLEAAGELGRREVGLCFGHVNLPV